MTDVNDVFTVNREKEEALLALQMRVKHYFGKSHLSAPQKVDPIGPQKVSDLEQRLTTLLKQRDCDDAVPTRKSWLPTLLPRNAATKVFPSDEMVKEIQDDVSIDIRKYNSDTIQLCRMADNLLQEIVDIEKGLEKAVNCIQTTHDALGKLAELQGELSKINGDEEGDKLCNSLMSSYDKYMLEKDVEGKISELMHLKQKHKALTWALPNLPSTSDAAKQPNSQLRGLRSEEE